MSSIHIRDLVKSYSTEQAGKIVSVLGGINLSVNDGEFITFFGPNGSGKTTLLKIIAGIEPYNGGEILIDSKSPLQARTGLIFQNYSDSLMPWLNCEDNILFAYSLEKRKHERIDAYNRLVDILTHHHISLPLKNYPYQLSGGQQQLVAILRTLIYRPDVILMDEPFSALDYQTRRFMQSTLLDIWHKERTTILFVSHDIEEAIFLADRLVLLTRLPARIQEIKDIHLPRPRSAELLESGSFFQLKRDCLQALRGEH
jgi:NitT/TauT family transport system ATP-binding protein